jgi:hypothetical protein
VLTNNSHAPSLKQRPFHKPDPQETTFTIPTARFLDRFCCLLEDRGHHGQQQWQAAGVIFIVGEVVLTLHPPLRPLSHDGNPQDEPPEIAASATSE